MTVIVRVCVLFPRQVAASPLARKGCRSNPGAQPDARYCLAISFALTASAERFRLSRSATQVALKQTDLSDQRLWQQHLDKSHTLALAVNLRHAAIPR